MSVSHVAVGGAGAASAAPAGRKACRRFHTTVLGRLTSTFLTLLILFAIVSLFRINSKKRTEERAVATAEMEKFLKLASITVVVDEKVGVRSGPAPLTATFAVVFENKSADGDPWSYYWDFGDGATSKEISPTHTFRNPADYSVHVVVTDDKGRTAPASTRVSVNGLLDVPAGGGPVRPAIIDMARALNTRVANFISGDAKKEVKDLRPPGTIHVIERGGKGWATEGMTEGSYTDWFIPAASGKGLQFNAHGEGVQEEDYWYPPGVDRRTYVPIYRRFYNKKLPPGQHTITVFLE